MPFELSQLEKLDEVRWLIPRGTKEGMLTDALVYADDRLMRDLIKDQSLEQAANVAMLPGIVGRSLAMPDPQLRPALSEDGYILLHGTDPPYLIDPFFFSTLASVGRWDPEPLRRMVAEKRFSEVVLTRPVETPLVVQGIPWIPEGVHEEIAKNYVFKTIEGRYYVYVPRP